MAQVIIADVGPEGPPGPAGTAGPTGPTGAGVPVGGNTGQIATKASNADYDVIWSNGPVAGNPGGSNGQIQFNSSGNFGGFTASGDATINSSTGHITVGKVNGQALTTVAFSGSYDDLANLPTLGTLAAQNTVSLTSQATGVVQAAQFPALGGDVFTTGNSLNTTISSHVVSYSKMQQATQGSVLLGNPTGTPGNLQEIVLGTNLSFSGNTLNATGGGSGGISTIAVASANGFAGSSSGGSTPTITLTTTITGLAKGNGTALSAATAGSDYSAGTAALATGILKSTTATGALSIAAAGDFPTLNQSTSGNAATATALQTSRTINGVAFDGTANIILPSTVQPDTCAFTYCGGA